ncbi:hypothetical protein FQA39_LY14070 [Lamprigera yunnana]|nr:hypothetical protein FQA39_LY14070 [Lamprigera yunnana]
MSLEVVNLKRKKPNEQFCLFCNNSSDLVKNPRPGTLIHIKEAANRRKDSISEKFSKLYDPDCTKQEFSWHQDCLATYISEEKIRRREIALYKEEEEVPASTSKANVEELTPKSRSSSRTPAALKKSLKCIFSAEKIFSTARIKEDHVFTELSTCQRPEDLFAIEMPAGRPSNQIPKEILMDAFDKLIDEIKDQLPTHSFQVRFLAERLAVLTNIEGAVIENRVVKSLLIDKFAVHYAHSSIMDHSILAQRPPTPAEFVLSQKIQILIQENQLKTQNEINLWNAWQQSLATIETLKGNINELMERVNILEKPVAVPNVEQGIENKIEYTPTRKN